jgi:class 3 adenylate cyclase
VSGGGTCPRCATVNPAGHRFCDGCGTPLVSRTPSAPARALPATPAHLVEKIRRERRTLEGERKLVTVLFADVVRSMEMAERVDPEEWLRVLDRFFQILAGGVHRFEGTIDHFTGDGIMALFGAPIAHEDHARRACHAALDLMSALGEYASSLAARGLAFAVRMGLNSGEVVLGRIGDDLHVEYTALGHTVGLAARMEQMAAPGTIFLTEHTARLVEGFFTLRDHGTPAMKGVTTPVEVYELLGPAGLRTRLDVSRRRGFSRLVGREAELARLWEALEEASTGRSRTVGVVGEAGVGKSRVCLEFVERCRAQGIAVHEAHCPAHGAAVPLIPMRELVRSLLDLGLEETTAGVRARVRERLVDDVVPLALELLGVGEVSAPVRADEPRAAVYAELVAHLVCQQSAAAPLVLLLDDAHWLDRDSEHILRRVADVVEGTPTLVVANFRSGYDASWIRHAELRRVSLEPLGQGPIQALLTELLGDDPSLTPLRDLLAERSGGNPFFAEEMVRALAACGTLAGRAGAYRLVAPIATLAIPPTVQSLLASRIDRLQPGTKDVLQTAAVIGKQFEEPLLRIVSRLDERALAGALGALAEGEFVHEVQGLPPARYAFCHPLTQEVAYQSLLAEHRARLHRAVAAALVDLHAERLGEHAELIAHHWDAGGMRYEAVRWRRRAALRVSSIQLAGKSRPPAPRST